MTVEDIADLSSALVPIPLRMDEMVAGLDRPLPGDELGRRYALARAAYVAADAADRLRLGQDTPDKSSPSRWLTVQLQARERKIDER
jgi:hypothetical protein